MNVAERIKTKKEIPLASKTIIHMMLVNNHIQESLTNALKPHEVSIQQFNVLRILRGQNGKAANLFTLNERMVTKMSNTTRLVDKLLAKGYVDRAVCEANRRKVEITITDLGKKALLKMDKAVMESELNMVGNFSKNEMNQLNNLLNKF